MGLQFPTKRKSDVRIPEALEIQALGALAKKHNMALLSKEYDQMYNNGEMVSNLDHILATNNITFNTWGKTPEQSYAVKVTGWQQLDEAARKTFIRTISDHCSLYCEVA